MLTNRQQHQLRKEVKHSLTSILTDAMYADYTAATQYIMEHYGNVPVSTRLSRAVGNCEVTHQFAERETGSEHGTLLLREVLPHAFDTSEEIPIYEQVPVYETVPVYRRVTVYAEETYTATRWSYVQQAYVPVERTRSNLNRPIGFTYEVSHWRETDKQVGWRDGDVIDYEGYDGWGNEYSVEIRKACAYAVARVVYKRVLADILEESGGDWPSSVYSEVYRWLENNLEVR